MPWQSVFYEIKTGKVICILKNKAIRKAAEKEEICPGYSKFEVGFTNVDGDERIDKENIFVSVNPDFGRPMVLTMDGRPLGLEMFIARARSELEGVQGIKYVFEGGFGDHLLQIAAMLEFRKAFPEKTIEGVTRAGYLDIFKNIKGIGRLSEHRPGEGDGSKFKIVSGRAEYMTDPRGIGYGKKSLYGSQLGLGQVFENPEIVPTTEDIAQGAELLKVYQRDPKRKLIGIQFGSASGSAKTWNIKNVLDFVRKIYEETKAEAVLFGRRWEYPREGTVGINFTGDRTWLETYRVLTNCDVVVTTDSGILHLARAMKKPYIGLWGGSTPIHILGEKDRPEDLRERMDCMNFLCMECRKKTNDCMKKIKPETVLNAIMKLLKEKKDGNLHTKTAGLPDKS